MSIYENISLQPSRRTLSVIHSISGQEKSGDAIGQARRMHSGVLKEAERLQKSWESFYDELKNRSIQSARGTLSQFLTTPLTSDAKEIQRILSDQIGQVVDQVLVPVPLAGIRGLLMEPAKAGKSTGPLGKMLASGRKRLIQAALARGRSGSVQFVSRFETLGGLNSEILRSILLSQSRLIEGNGQERISVLDEVTLIHSIEPASLKEAQFVALALFDGIHLDSTESEKRLIDHLDSRSSARKNISIRAERSLIPADVGPRISLLIQSDDMTDLNEFCRDLLGRKKTGSTDPLACQRGALITGSVVGAAEEERESR